MEVAETIFVTEAFRSPSGVTLWVDVVEFSNKIEDAMQADNINLFLEAVDLYQGDFLEGFSVPNAFEYESWQSTQQVRLREVLVFALQKVSQHWTKQGDFDQAINATRRIVDVEPWREEAHRHLMELFASNGDRAAALAQFEICCKAMADELDLEPSPETVALMEEIRDGSFKPIPIDAPPQALSLMPHLFGIEAARDELLESLWRTDRPWLLSIDGIGGIGKTTLAEVVVDAMRGTDRFGRVAWVSAKQEEFNMGFGTESTRRAALNADHLVDSLLEQLTDQNLTAPPREKEQQLQRLLKEEPTLVVIDNLETMADYEALIPSLRDLANPSKFLITSRHPLAQYNDVFCLTLGEIPQQAAFDLLRHEAKMRGVRGLSDASDADLAPIIEVVGGHPLALNLVLGQLSFMPLPQVLANLQQATGERIEDFYTYIYWQAWQALDDSARRLLLAMPMLHNATYEQQAAVTELSAEQMQPALTQLINLSLLQVGGDVNETRYRLHRLTETFLMNEVLKWNDPSARTTAATAGEDETAADETETDETAADETDTEHATPAAETEHAPPTTDHEADVQPTDAQPRARDGTNPDELSVTPDPMVAHFVAGPPIEQPHLFFGRTDQLTRVFGWWQQPPLSHIALIGPRRSGKTSLLKHLPTIPTAVPSSLRADQKRDWLSSPEQVRWIDINFQDPRMGRLDRLLHRLLTGFGYDAPESCSLETFMDVACAQEWDQPAIVLMDELGAGLAAPELDQNFWWTLRALAHATNGYLSFVVAAHEQPTYLAANEGKTSPFFNIFTTLKLGPFADEEARHLVASSPIEFDKADTEWILEESGRWPFLLQICCQERLAALEASQDNATWKEIALERMEPFL